MTVAKVRQFDSYAEISQELKELVKQAKSKELSLEESLDIFEQAIEYASHAIDLVDTSEFTLAEEQELQQKNKNTPADDQISLVEQVGEESAAEQEAEDDAEEKQASSEFAPAVHEADTAQEDTDTLS